MPAQRKPDAGYIEVGPGRYMPADEVQANRDNQFHPSQFKIDPSELWAPPPPKGESDPISVRLSHQQIDQIAQLCASQRWPFRKPSDFLRAAVSYFLKNAVMPNEPRLMEELKVEEETAASARKKKRLSDAGKVLDNQREYLVNLVQLGLIDRAMQEWDDIETGIMTAYSDRELAGAMVNALRKSASLADLQAKREARPRLVPVVKGNDNDDDE